MTFKNWRDVTPDFLRYEDEHVIFKIEFDNEWKEIKFETLPGTVLRDYYYSEYCVYVGVPEESDQRGNGPYYENKVWPALLQLKMIDNRIYLQLHYTVLGKFATVLSWIDSEKGKRLKSIVGGGNGSATPDNF